ncbi:hypothetical protein Nepgr_012972 [Nepenthes gracilis]|uniref:OTU domain-containing protein 5 n=1 Tax=Nepenthes gracilis TaxID=150966 RepID=A0AAD3XNV4_NEPGR|nr:hypothetical protein Nepgr_012972 [Nepenthes gracilis]
MTRILVQRGSGSSSSNQSRSSLSSSSTSTPQLLANPPQVNTGLKEEDSREELHEQVAAHESVDHCATGPNKTPKGDDLSNESFSQSENENDEIVDGEKVSNDSGSQVNLIGGFSGLMIMEHATSESEAWSFDVSQSGTDSSQPPPPPVPPPKPLATNSSLRRALSGAANSGRIGSSRRAAAWSVSTRTSPSGSRPSSPRSHCETEGYNSADEQNSCFGFSFDDLEREKQFETDIRRAKGFEVKRMVEDGNCLFRAVADQVYGDSEAYEVTRQMCIDYMERERDHFSQFITEGFTSYCKRKRRDKVYGNNVEIQAMSEMYNRPIHIYSYTTEPINIFHGSYNTDSPPIRVSYHHGNHYNSLVDPRRLTIGSGLGFSSLRGRNVDKDQVKAAIKAQQDQQIDNALLAEGRFYSDLELTEKEIERMVMEASRAEYLAGSKFKTQLGQSGSSTSGAEPSSSGARPSGSNTEKHHSTPEMVLSNSVQMVLSMGFNHLQVIEAYSIFGDDVDSMVCYLVEMGSSSSRRKGKATE